MRFSRHLLTCAIAALATAGLGHADPEPTFPAHEREELPEREAEVLNQADRQFAARQFPAATASYDAFIMEFPRSRAVPYALLRKSRSLHLDNKRVAAIREYNEVPEYFPNQAAYAAPAIFYMGLAHAENGHMDQARRAWRRMVEDFEYVEHPLAAEAMNRLADGLVEKGHWPEAVRYYRKVAVDYRTRNANAANHGIARMTEFLIRIRPDERQLRALFAEAGGFGEQPRPVPEDLSDDRDYWGAVRDLVERHGQFDDGQEVEAQQYFTYWAGLLLRQQRDWDDFQIAAIGWQYRADGDRAGWVRRLDRQFQDHQRDGDFLRIVRWIRAFRDERPKAMEYYDRIQFPRMDATEIFALMRALYEDVGDAALATHAFREFNWNGIPDRASGQTDKVGIARYLWRRNPDQVEEVYRQLDDKDLGQIELLRFYSSRREVDKAIPVAGVLTEHPEHADEALWTLAGLLQEAERFAEALAAYRRVDRVPDRLWKIAECHEGLGEVDKAIGALREIEAAFEPLAPQAALEIAYLYDRAGNRDHYLAHLRHVLRRYPASEEARKAHLALERASRLRLGRGIQTDRD